MTEEQKTTQEKHRRKEGTHESGFYDLEGTITRVLMATASLASVMAMAALLAIGFFEIGKAVALYFSRIDLPPEYSSRSIAALEVSTHGLEFLFLAPLSYLLILSVARYLEHAIKGSVPNRVRGELLIVKGFGIALFIAVVAASMVGKVLGADGISYKTALSGSLIIVVLGAYLFFLEKLASPFRAEE